MYCPKCGASNPDDVGVCQSCNGVLSDTSETAARADVETSGPAKTALVLGILSIFTFGITIIPAIIYGIVALVKIAKSGGKLKGRGLSITGIAFSVMMLTFLITAFLQVRALAHRMMCGNNIDGLSKAIMMYQSDYNEKYPTSSQWCDLLVKYADVQKEQFRCPSAPKGQSSYAMNKNIEKMEANSPPDMVVLFETSPGWNQSGGRELLTTKNHKEGCYFTFNNGHVEFIKREDVNNLRW